MCFVRLEIRPRVRVAETRVEGFRSGGGGRVGCCLLSVGDEAGEDSEGESERLVLRDVAIVRSRDFGSLMLDGGG
jgi:hypothetical protein